MWAAGVVQGREEEVRCAAIAFDVTGVLPIKMKQMSSPFPTGQQMT